MTQVGISAALPTRSRPGRMLAQASGKKAWDDAEDYRGGRIPIWVGGNSDAALRRAVRLGDAWHPLRCTLGWLRGAVDRMNAVADELRRPPPAFVPRIALRLTASPVTDPGRLAGEGTIDQVVDDLEQLRLLGADTVVLDPFSGDPLETYHPDVAWQVLATVATRYDLRWLPDMGSTPRRAYGNQIYERLMPASDDTSGIQLKS